ncbi:oligosaccharide flippase family protein, partial [Escherichia albertii]|nr:oligosaccharide flippase family protein [Escherichia albertii]
MATLKKNVISLGMVQIFIYIIPLLQFPYLTRTLGVDCFGVVAYSLS